MPATHELLMLPERHVALAAGRMVVSLTSIKECKGIQQSQHRNEMVIDLAQDSLGFLIVVPWHLPQSSHSRQVDGLTYSMFAVLVPQSGTRSTYSISLCLSSVVTPVVVAISTRLLHLESSATEIASCFNSRKPTKVQLPSFP